MAGLEGSGGSYNPGEQHGRRTSLRRGAGLREAGGPPDGAAAPAEASAQVTR